jgi:hypothetical protein
MTLEIEHGHVTESGPGSSAVGYPLFEEKEEVALLERLLHRAKARGFRVVADTGLIGKKTAPKKKVGDARSRRWTRDADEILQMWRADEYDNYKDAILDVRSMLAKPPKDQEARVSRLEKMLAKATRELAKLAAKDPGIAAYARGLIRAGATKAKRAARTAPT